MRLLAFRKRLVDMIIRKEQLQWSILLRLHLEKSEDMRETE